MYNVLHIYKKHHISYRCFKKASIKKHNEFKKKLIDAFTYMDTDNVNIILSERSNRKKAYLESIDYKLFFNSLYGLLG